MHIAVGQSPAIGEGMIEEWGVGTLERAVARMVSLPEVEMFRLSHGTAHVVAASDMAEEVAGATGLGNEVMDHRYYQVVGNSLGEFKLQYMVLLDRAGNLGGVQAFFVLQQNILAGVQGRVARMVEVVR